MLELSQCFCLLDLVQETPKLDDEQLTTLSKREAPRTLGAIASQRKAEPIRWGDKMDFLAPVGNERWATCCALGLLAERGLVEIHFASSRSSRKLYTITKAGEKVLRDSGLAAG